MTGRRNKPFLLNIVREMIRGESMLTRRVVWTALLWLAPLGAWSGENVTSQSPPHTEADSSAEAGTGRAGGGDFSIPVRIVESEEERATAKKANQEARNREESDLQAQWTAAKAAAEAARYSKEQVEIGWWQFWLATFGSAAVVGSLGLTTYSVALTRRALRDTREIGESQLSAYLGPTEVEYNVLDDKFTVTIGIKNAGQTPALFAYISKMYVRMFFRDRDGSLQEAWLNMITPPQVSVLPGEVVKHTLSSVAAHFDKGEHAALLQRISQRPVGIECGLVLTWQNTSKTWMHNEIGFRVPQAHPVEPDPLTNPIAEKSKAVHFAFGRWETPGWGNVSSGTLHGPDFSR